MKRELEGLLFATDSPLTIARLRKLFPDVETKELRETIKELQDEYEKDGHAFDVVEFGGGFQIATRPEFAPIVEKMLKGRRFTRLSKAGLEVLAIIAYRQPITRLEVDDIRGVNSSGAISTLTERNLITVVGRSQTVGNPLLYGTTREFLNHLGLKGLGQLPDLPDLESVMDDKDELKEFASQVGRDVTEEELDDYFAVPEAHDTAANGEPAPTESEVLEDPSPDAPAETAEDAATDDSTQDDSEIQTPIDSDEDTLEAMTENEGQDERN